ncbi:unnamed protein product [Cylindrotheca closterium]|uniref:Pentacotripeptide-repeat region of PRORP domain-containing protein n=1 Tax=Cylindrotheca closterium TaxID=2856 RepID=A0AAD2FIF5_9STRA|nr:unnamed protein product [Cylindrotheca closterium]
MPKQYERKSNEEKMRESVDLILNAPIGSLQPNSWLEAHKVIEHIAEIEKISEAFRILDRLAKEPTAKTKLSHDAIYTVVQKWFTMCHHQKKMVFPPMKVWQNIEAYEKVGIIMESRTYHRIIEALAIGKFSKPSNKYGPVGPVLAEKILERMMEKSSHSNPVVRPSTYTFNAVLVAWQNAASRSSWAKKEAPQRSLALLNKLKMLYDARWGPELSPDKDVYRRVMNIFAHRGEGDQVEALLEEMYERYWDEGQPANLVPTNSHFSLVLFAWSKSDDPSAAERANQILERMLEMETSGEIPGLQVSAFCFNIVMICMSRARTKEAALEVQKLFERMLELAKTDKAKKPVGGTYTALIGNWSSFDAAKAEEVFWTWKEEHENGKCGMKLDSRLLGTLIAGCYKSKTIPDTAERCDRLLQYALGADLKTFEPSVVLFNMTINAYCRKKTMGGVERAEELLRQMEDYKDILSPTIFSYVPIIQTLAGLGHVERAEQLLLEWYSSEGRNKKSNHSPSMKMKKRLDTQTFNSLLRAWLSKTKINPEAAARAEELLLTMRRLGVRTNALSFQLALQCRQRANHDSIQTTRDWERVDDIVSFLYDEYKSGAPIKNDTLVKMVNDWSVLKI